MTLKSVLQWLLDHGYGVIIGDQFVLTNKVNEELAIGKTGSPIKVETKPAVINKSVVKVTLPNSKKDIWNKFVEDAEIPFRVKATDGGTYTVKQYGSAAANELERIVSDPSIDYQVLVESTKYYYKTVSYKALLSNYLLKQIWRGEYDEWLKGKKTFTPGENRFED
jgi:hypothetical protein